MEQQLSACTWFNYKQSDICNRNCYSKNNPDSVISIRTHETNMSTNILDFNTSRFGSLIISYKNMTPDMTAYSMLFNVNVLPKTTCIVIFMKSTSNVVLIKDSKFLIFP